VNLQHFMDKIQTAGTDLGLKILAGLAVLIIGRWVAKRLTGIVRRLMARAKVDEMLVRFIGNLLYAVLLVFIILAAVGQLGVQTTSFVAVLGAAGLAVGLALQGSLGNFAAGVLIVLFRPYRVGDFIEVGHIAGVVEEVQIFTSVLVTLDNKKVIVPNGQIMNGTITNYSAKEHRRVDAVASVSYAEDLDRVRSVLLAMMGDDARILKDPAPAIVVLELAASSVNLSVRCWVKPVDYWLVFFHVNEQIKKCFDRAGINIPFPQQDVHLYQHGLEAGARSSAAGISGRQPGAPPA